MWACTSLRKIFKLVIANGNVIKRLRRLTEHSWVIKLKIPDHLRDILPSNTWWFQASNLYTCPPYWIEYQMGGLGPIFIPFPFPTSQSFIAICSVFIYSAVTSEFHFWLYILLWTANRSKLQVYFCYSGHFSLKGTVGRLNKLERIISSTAQMFCFSGEFPSAMSI